MSAFFERFKRLDIYREIPKDLTHATTTGGFVSIFCVLSVLYLFVSELALFMTPEFQSYQLVDATKDTGDSHAMLTINMNISLPKLPCKIVSLDVQDIMGSHIMNVEGELHKVRLDQDGFPHKDKVKEKHEVGKGGHKHDPDDEEHGSGHGHGRLDESVKEQKGEGCRLEGHIQVKKVPGNFHISAHAHAEYMGYYFSNENPMNVTHVIHHLWFGESQDDYDAFGRLPKGKNAVLNPLENASKSASLTNGEDPVYGLKSYEYYIEIVPTELQTRSGHLHSAYQFVANSNEVVGRYRIPALYFRYETSAITVRFVEESKSFAHFLVQICAIIGGVFTVLGVFNAVLNTTVQKLIEKSTVGKLG